MRKMKTVLTFALLVMMTGFGFAQQKNQPGSWRFQSINSVGLLEGQAGSAFQLQTVNGARYFSWFAGIGVGLDNYRLRTIPIFLDVRKEFGNSSNKFFVYADAGISFSWIPDNEKMPYTQEHFSNGFYDDFGFGYKAALGKKNALQVSLGYSYKNLTDTYTYGYYNVDPPTGNPPEKISYYLNRLSIKLGWSF